MAALPSFAISLGRSQGAALLGRPLDVAIRLSPDSESTSDLCADVDVFYAETRVDKSRIRSSVEKSGNDTLIRVRASTVIDEPVVTLYVRAGCIKTVEKRYVFLADPVPEASSPAPAAPVSPANDSAGTRNTVVAGASAPRLMTPSVASAEPSIAVLRKNRPAVARDAASPSSSARPAPRVREKAGARLKLEPLDLTVEVSPQLKSSSDLLSLPAASPEQRSAAAALWKALAAQPEDIVKDAEKIRLIEDDLRRIHVETRTNQASLADLRMQLQREVDTRYSSGVIYALVAALVLAVAGVAYLLHRGGRDEDGAAVRELWWRRRKTEEVDWSGSELDGSIFNAPEAPVDSELSRTPPSGSAFGAPEAKTSRPSSRRNVLSRAVPPISKRDQPEFALSMPHTPRAVKAEELFDVQHQAEFFMSLGQFDQAVAVLRSHISGDEQTSALIYLDLFSLYHQLKRRSDYEALRVEFNHLFNAKIPVFEEYTTGSQGLDTYEAAMSRIMALWPSPKVLDVIEESVFRKPGSQTEVFDIEAYRELLFLYGIAKEIVEAPSSQSESLLDFDLLLPDHEPTMLERGRSAGAYLSTTAIQPLSAAMDDSAADELPRIPRISAFAPAEASLALDIDLTTLARQSADSEGKTLSGSTAGRAARDPSKGTEPAYNMIDFDVSSRG